MIRYALDTDILSLYHDGNVVVESRVHAVAASEIGITPISAMARRAKALGMDYSVHYSGRKQSSMALLDDLAKLHGERLHVYVSDEGAAQRSPRATCESSAGCEGLRLRSGTHAAGGRSVLRGLARRLAAI